MNKTFLKLLTFTLLGLVGCSSTVNHSKCVVGCNPVPNQTGSAFPEGPNPSNFSGQLVATDVVATNPMASNWNDFFQVGTNVSCSGSELNCIHGGELKKIKVSGTTTCSDLRVEDALFAFDWICSEAGGQVEFNGRVKSGQGLAQLIDPSILSWIKNSVGLFQNNKLAYRTSETTWWNNQIQEIPNSSLSIVTLNSTGVIYVVKSSYSSKGIHISAPKISIVIPLGATIKGDSLKNFNFGNYSLTSPNQSSVIVVEKQPFVSVEGENSWTLGDTNSTKWSIDGDNKVMNLIASRDSNYFRMKNLNLTNSVQHTVLPVGSFGMKTSNINLKGSHFFGIREQDVKSAEYKNINVYDCANTGFVSFGSHDSFYSNLFFARDLHGFANGESVNATVNDIVVEDVSSIGTSMRSSVGGKYFNFSVKQSGYGLYIYGGASNGNHFSKMSFTKNKASGVYSEGKMSNSTFDEISSINNGFGGLGDDDSIFEDVTKGSGGNVYKNIVTSNNKGNGMTINSNGAVLQNILSVNNGLDGINIKAPVKAVVMATIMNNLGHGINQDFADAGTTYHKIASVNNGGDGFHLRSETLGATFSEIATAQNGGYGIFIGDTITKAKVKLGGKLIVSLNALGNCRLSNAGMIGIANSLCEGSYPSNVFVYVPSITANSIVSHAVPTSVISSFVGPLIPGPETRKINSEISNWIVSSASFRTWGKDSGGRGPCLSSETCQINDFSLQNSDTVLRNVNGNGSEQNEVATDGGSCPTIATGDLNQITSNESITYLLNAVEDSSAPTSNENGLCESGESCIYSPNFGAYQGEGATLSCNFSSSNGLENVKIKTFSINGRL